MIFTVRLDCVCINKNLTLCHSECNYIIRDLVEEINFFVYLTHTDIKTQLYGARLNNSSLEDLSFYSPQFVSNARHPPPTHTTYFICFFLWRFLGGHSVKQTSQGRMGGGIRLLCDIGQRDQRSVKPLQICNPCVKTHTTHPHCKNKD